MVIPKAKFTADQNHANDDKTIKLLTMTLVNSIVFNDILQGNFEHNSKKCHLEQWRFKWTPELFLPVFLLKIIVLLCCDSKGKSSCCCWSRLLVLAKR